MNKDSYNRLFIYYKPSLMNYACNFCYDTSDAEDLIQETYIKGLESLNMLSKDSSLRFFLTRILRNQHYNKLRRKHLNTKRAEGKRFIRIRTESPDNRFLPEETFIRKETKEIIQRAIKSLPSHLRSSLILHELGQKTYHCIAAGKRIPVGTVRSRIHRGKKKLRIMLKSLKTDEN